jgi:hypothetical protein
VVEAQVAELDFDAMDYDRIFPSVPKFKIDPGIVAEPMCKN